MNEFCPVCGGFLEKGKKIHPFCMSEAIECAKKIRDYINENHNVKANDLIEDLEIKRELINYLLDEEILTYEETSSVFHKCKNCLCVIIDGDYCDKCQSKLLNDLNGTFGKKKVLTSNIPYESKGKMYTQHLRKK